MDKIPAALQHKIDYINALDISTNDKQHRIGNAMLIYFAGNNRKNLHVSGIAPDDAKTDTIKSIPATPKPINKERNLSRFLWAGELGICVAIGFVIGVIFGNSL